MAVKPIDGKFGINEQQQIVNLVSGEVIPDDEPLFLLRARDHHAIQTLRAYLQEVRLDCNELHISGAQTRLKRFEQFAKEHPERMKQPGITKHLNLAHEEHRE